MMSDGARRYLQYGLEQGYDQRYLTRHRQPWYALEQRQPSPLLFGVFSRGQLKIIRNCTSALNLACYHGLVLAPGIDPVYADKLFIYLKSSTAHKAMQAHKRIYGRDLTKFEPNDLSGILVPSPAQFAQMSAEFTAAQLACIASQGCLNEEGERFFAEL